MFSDLQNGHGRSGGSLFIRLFGWDAGFRSFNFRSFYKFSILAYGNCLADKRLEPALRKRPFEAKDRRLRSGEPMVSAGRCIVEQFRCERYHFLRFVSFEQTSSLLELDFATKRVGQLFLGQQPVQNVVAQGFQVVRCHSLGALSLDVGWLGTASPRQRNLLADSFPGEAWRGPDTPDAVASGPAPRDGYCLASACI